MKKLLGVLLFCLASIGGAQANLVEFTFQETVGGWAPCYLNSTCPLMPGVSVGDLITVTVIADNGGSSLVNQSWYQTDVISATAAVGGSYSGEFRPPFHINDPIFSTDAAGSLNWVGFYDTDLGNPDSLGNSISLSSNAIASDRSDGSIQYSAFFQHGTSNSSAHLDFWSVSVVPAAADDGPIAVTEGVAQIIPVGSNDTGFTDPVTVTVTTPPTKGTITAISPTGPAASMTITYTADIGATGSDSFVYEMTDSTPSTDSATVTLNISPPPDADGDGVSDDFDNCPANANVDQSDTDDDGRGDVCDNCTLVVNTQAGNVLGTSPPIPRSQLDADNDGFGNRCDGDLNNTGAVANVNTTDYTILRSVINKAYTYSTNAARADMNGDGAVNTTDYTIFRSLINNVPGPSGYTCAGTIPCP